MKKLICALLITFTELSAAWEEHWTDAVTACHEKRYEDAEKLFTSAIYELRNDPKHAHVYIDRGRLYLLLEKDEEALKDIEEGLNGNLTCNDKLRAMVSKVAVLYRLERFEEAEEARKSLLDLQSVPHLEVYDKKVIIRNIPDSEWSQMTLRNFVADIFCNSVEDVVIQNGICIAHRKETAEPPIADGLNP